MKVLYLTNLPTPYRVNFFNELGKYCDLTVLFERRTAKDRDESWLMNSATNFDDIFLESIRIGNDNSLTLKIIGWLIDCSYDIIVIGGYSTFTSMLAISYLNIKKIPFVLNSDGGFIKSDKFMIYHIKKYFISSAMHWLSTSKITDEYLIHYGASVDNIYRYPFTSMRQNDFLTNVIPYLEKESYRKELNIHYNNMILSVGQFITRKGFDILIKASNQLKDDTGVYIVGGEPTDEYIDLMNTYDIHNVHFIRFMPKELLKKYFLSADLFVLPTREDIWGLVINESLAYGLPVITTNKCIAGIELIKNGVNGFIVNSEDINGIAKKINDLLTDKNKLLEMSSNCIDLIQEYTIEEMAKVHNGIFERIRSEPRCK